MASSPLAQARVLAQMALRSLASHKVKSLIVGSIMVFGTALVVVGTSLLDSVEAGMERSIVKSLSGHLQLYDAEAKDDLALFGGTTMGGDDYGEVPDFGEVQRVVQAQDGVEAVVPMGLGIANMSRGSELDRALDALRRAVEAGDVTTREALITRVQRLLELMHADLVNSRAITADTTELDANLAFVERARQAGFWAPFGGDDLLAKRAALDFLDTRVAPAGGDGVQYYLRYLGTDLPLFARVFDRFRIVEGEPVPEGRRGLLMNKRFADSQLKLKVARLLDQLHDAVTLNDERIADDPALTAKARQARSLYGSLTLMLSPEDAAALEETLRATFPDVTPTEGQSDLDALMQAALTVDDATLKQRYAFFYEQIAPRVELYPFRVGDVLTLRAFTKRGYMKSVNVKVYGTFEFAGLERSELSGAANLVDLMTFRDLYGQMTEAQQAELKAIQAEVGLEHVDRAEAEDAFFGGADDSVEKTADGSVFGDFDVAKIERDAGARVADDRPFTREQMMNGVVLNAAVVLEDGVDVDDAKARVQAAVDAAGLKLKVVDWRAASGVIGQFVMVIRGVLLLAIGIIFIVALVIINNSMLMATLERVREIGTLRAIGAQRRFVMAMVMLETLVLGLLSGTVGAGLGAALVSWMGAVGIPAKNDILVFLFSGPRLHPTVGASNLLVALVVILVVSLISTWYPARIATRVQPVEAMREA